MTEQTQVVEKVQGLLTQFTNIYPLEEFLDQEDVKDNLKLKRDWQKIAYDVKWQGLVEYLHKPHKSLHWPMGAGFADAGSQMKYSTSIEELYN